MATTGAGTGIATGTATGTGKSGIEPTDETVEFRDMEEALDCCVMDKSDSRFAFDLLSGTCKLAPASPPDWLPAL